VTRVGALQLGHDSEELAHRSALTIEIKVEGAAGGPLTKHGVQLRVGSHTSKARLVDQELSSRRYEQPPLIAGSAVVGGVGLDHTRRLFALLGRRRRMRQADGVVVGGNRAHASQRVAVALFAAYLVRAADWGSRSSCGRKIRLTWDFTELRQYLCPS
jgi:hypothetical protein